MMKLLFILTFSLPKFMKDFYFNISALICLIAYHNDLTSKFHIKQHAM